MQRGSNVELTREIRNLTDVVVGVRLNAGSETALADNLVTATLLCDASHRVPSDDHFVFFNQLKSPDLSVAQLESAMGDDTDQIEVDLEAVPSDIDSVVAVAYVNDSPQTRRTLGQLKECRVRVLNLADNAEIIRSEDLAATLDIETAIVLGELYRHRNGWKFRVIGQGYASGIRGIAVDYGLTL
ncbi:MAG: TerD family protein [Actinomycetota bacterium]|nr:TerD family protein [Actinomycetota bacterium]